MGHSLKSKIGIAILDIIVILMGLVLLVAGLWFKLQSGLLSENTISLLNYITYNNIKLGYMLHTIALLVAILGGLMIVVAVLGMCGGWKMVKGCLVLYMVLTVFLLLVQAVSIGLTVSVYSKTDTWLRGKMLNLLTTYSGPTATDSISEGWNSLFIDARCCAVTNQFANGGTNNDFQDMSTTWYANRAGDNLPASCCQGVTSDTVSSYVSSSHCTTPPTNFYEKGCWNRIKDTSKFLMILIISACFIAIVVEIASLVLSCVVMDNAKNRIRSTGPIRGHSKPAPPYVGMSLQQLSPETDPTERRRS